MKKLFIGIFAVTVLLTACNKDKENSTDIFTKVYKSDNILSQTFSINGDKDTVIKGNSGTVLRIYKNTFFDGRGQLVKGEINIELKEVFSPNDIVLGNLTTTFDGKNLESGGMIYINASSNGQQLKIAEDKIIGGIMPCDKQDNEMQIFQGKMDSLKINWGNPEPILNGQIQRQEFEQTTVTWQTPDGITKVENDAIGDTLLERYSDVQSDTSVMVNGKNVKMMKPIKQNIIIDTTQGNAMRFMQEIRQPKGTNLFMEDYNVNYIFAIKKLGWANIDRLFEDPRTKEVELIISIDNQSDFNTIYVSMIISNQKMYIPGYQKADNTFSFTHGDFEKSLLPIGETATILATAYKNDKPYFAIKKITITDKQTVSFKLDETTMDNLKSNLKEKI